MLVSLFTFSLSICLNNFYGIFTYLHIQFTLYLLGRDTKAMLNNGGPRHKRTGLEKLMNLEVVWCVVILAVLCIVGATGSALWLSTFDELGVPFIIETEDTKEPGVVWTKIFTNFLTFIIILQVCQTYIFTIY